MTTCGTSWYTSATGTSSATRSVAALRVPRVQRSTCTSELTASALAAIVGSPGALLIGGAPARRARGSGRGNPYAKEYTSWARGGTAQHRPSAGKPRARGRADVRRDRDALHSGGRRERS